jgi:DNA-binding transcriptional MerR regulator
MKYLTTLEVAQQLAITKQTLLNWLYSGKVPEPPRDRNGYRLWSLSRLTLIRRLIADGRVHRRTVVHREPSRRPELVAEFAREVSQFLRDGEIELSAFWKELSRIHPAAKPARRPPRTLRRHR